ncbi:MAG: hypothetical protein AAF631_10830 [Pseudomonadota bacterium]
MTKSPENTLAPQEPSSPHPQAPDTDPVRQISTGHVVRDVFKLGVLSYIPALFLAMAPAGAVVGGFAAADANFINDDYGVLVMVFTLWAWISLVQAGRGAEKGARPPVLRMFLRAILTLPQACVWAIFTLGPFFFLLYNSDNVTSIFFGLVCGLLLAVAITALLILVPARLMAGDGTRAWTRAQAMRPGSFVPAAVAGIVMIFIGFLLTALVTALFAAVAFGNYGLRDSFFESFWVTMIISHLLWPASLVSPVVHTHLTRQDPSDPETLAKVFD